MSLGNNLGTNFGNEFRKMQILAIIRKSLGTNFGNGKVKSLILLIKLVPKSFPGFGSQRQIRCKYAKLLNAPFPSQKVVPRLSY